MGNELEGEVAEGVRRPDGSIPKDPKLARVMKTERAAAKRSLSCLIRDTKRNIAAECERSVVLKFQSKIAEKLKKCKNSHTMFVLLSNLDETEEADALTWWKEVEEKTAEINATIEDYVGAHVGIEDPDGECINEEEGEDEEDGDSDEEEDEDSAEEDDDMEQEADVVAVERNKSKTKRTSVLPPSKKRESSRWKEKELEARCRKLEKKLKRMRIRESSSSSSSSDSSDDSLPPPR